MGLDLGHASMVWVRTQGMPMRRWRWWENKEGWQWQWQQPWNHMIYNKDDENDNDGAKNYNMGNT
jgi:hypothetical protein